MISTGVRSERFTCPVVTTWSPLDNPESTSI